MKEKKSVMDDSITLMNGGQICTRLEICDETLGRALKDISINRCGCYGEDPIITSEVEDHIKKVRQAIKMIISEIINNENKLGRDLAHRVKEPDKFMGFCTSEAAANTLGSVADAAIASIAAMTATAMNEMQKKGDGKDGN